LGYPLHPAPLFPEEGAYIGEKNKKLKKKNYRKDKKEKIVKYKSSTSTSATCNS